MRRDQSHLVGLCHHRLKLECDEGGEGREEGRLKTDVNHSRRKTCSELKVRH